MILNSVAKIEVVAKNSIFAKEIAEHFHNKNFYVDIDSEFCSQNGEIRTSLKVKENVSRETL